MLALMDEGGEIQEIGNRIIAIDAAPQNPGRDLPMQHLRRDVGMVGRHLPPAGLATIGRQPHKTDFGRGEAFQPCDPHPKSPVPFTRNSRKRRHRRQAETSRQRRSRPPHADVISLGEK